ncbi:hypothetical protein BpHYR1_026530 [Brachionus plicatilis]|uniref:Uncharacterized protein n=1 Tax=Brachionus plicatilis TaxID=10195 RepID=A0A3M7QUR9_BRAPC|nr:hypothetical protein BpHYR1_026530 [Brachionus plicatilis]
MVSKSFTNQALRERSTTKQIFKRRASLNLYKKVYVETNKDRSFHLKYNTLQFKINFVIVLFQPSVIRNVIRVRI